MLSYLETGSGRITYRLERSQRKYLLIRIEDNGGVCVRAPSFFPSAQIEHFLHQKSKWIMRKSQEQQDRHVRYSAKRFVHGQEFLFLGRKYPLKIVHGRKRGMQIDFDGQSWLVHMPPEFNDQVPQIREKLIQWYKVQAQELLAVRVFHYSRIMDLVPGTIRIRSQKCLWGSCDQTKKVIHLNWQIIMAPLSVIDYVIVHELCHLRIANHSKRFWLEVMKVMPDYRLKHQWLKQHSWDMQLPQDGGQ